MNFLEKITEKIKGWYESKNSIGESEIVDNFKKNYCNPDCKSDPSESCAYTCQYFHIH